MWKIRICALATATALAGCTASSTDGDHWVEALEGAKNTSSMPTYPSNGLSRLSAGSPRDGGTGFATMGSGTFSKRTPPASDDATIPSVPGAFTINLVDAPVASVTKAVLGDIFKSRYVVDPRVTGTITLQTGGSATSREILETFESALSANGATLVRKADRLEIVPASEALANLPVTSAQPSSKGQPGAGIQLIQLQHISASEMANVLEPISRKGAIIRADDARNSLMVTGSVSDIAAMRETIAVFDVDWMAGMSVAILPLKSVQAGDIVGELNSIFGVKDGPNAKSIKFVPNAKLNAILVITSRPQLVQKATAWIRKLDTIAEASDDQMFVYEIQNRPAAEFAKIVQSALAAGFASTAPGNTASPVAPDLASETLESGTPVGEGVSYEPVSSAASTSSSAPVVVADIENNALLISASPRDYKRIEKILRRLDVLPIQVMLEATIAEVTLNDELKFGLRWYLEEGNSGYTLTDLANGAIEASFPGFGWTRATANSKLALSALSGVTNVKIISSPTLMVINNQKATLQVGDQVPIITQNSTSTTTDSVIVNSVELRDTGIILSVTPRINSSGRVMLDIQQEVSNVVPTTTSGIDSPTIQQRKISTRVVVNDGESLALGGLIQERKNRTDKKMPILGDLPILGNAFKAKTDGINRTELVIFIRPKVVRDVQSARDVTNEFREQFNSSNYDAPAARIRRDMKRLAF